MSKPPRVPRLRIGLAVLGCLPALAAPPSTAAVTTPCLTAWSAAQADTGPVSALDAFHDGVFNHEFDHA